MYVTRMLNCMHEKYNIHVLCMDAHDMHRKIYFMYVNFCTHM